MGTVAATFAIDESGRVRDIHVLRAKHPGAAWFVVDAVDRAAISHERIAEHQQAGDLTFPVPLCVWWRYGPADKHGLP
jgi:hypothetical protein